MSEQKTNWVRGLNSLRFILALIVLLSHLHDPYVDLFKAQHTSSGLIIAILTNHLFCGNAAVIAFFIISGFVIHYPNRLKNKLDVVPFLVRRWLRLGIPVVILSLVAIQFHAFGRLPLWSLFCELIYYALYPILFTLKLNWKTQTFLAYMLSIIFIIFFIVDGHHLLSHRTHFTGLYWLLGITMIYLPAWLLGVLLSTNIDRVTAVTSRGRIWAVRLLVFALSTVCVALKMQYHINYDYTLVFFALLLYKWLEQEIVYYRSHAPSPFVEYLGRFSYTMYLSHGLCFLLISQFFANTVYTYFVYIILTIVLSWIVYLLLEYPSHKFAQKASASLAANEIRREK